MFKQKIAPLVYARFYDHMQDSAPEAKPIVCEVFGILKSDDGLSLVICPWICNFNLSDPNSDAYCILKSTVLEYRQIDLKEGRNASPNEKRYSSSQKTHKRNHSNGVWKKQ